MCKVFARVVSVALTTQSNVLLIRTRCVKVFVLGQSLPVLCPSACDACGHVMCVVIFPVSRV
jgi:hypothetical protein